LGFKNNDLKVRAVATRAGNVSQPQRAVPDRDTAVLITVLKQILY